MATEERLTGFDPRLLYIEGISLGQADLVVGGSTNQVVGRTIALSLIAFRDAEGKNAFDGITVIAPPLSVWPKSEADILEMVVKGVEAFRDRPDSQEINIIRKRLTIRRCETLQTDRLVAEVEAAVGQFIMVPMVHVYRDIEIPEPHPQGRAAAILPEDFWVPQVASLAPRCIKKAQITNSYLVFETSEMPPANEAHKQLLSSIDRLYPAYAEYVGDPDPSPILHQNMTRWTALAANGRVDEVLDEIALLNISASFKMQLEVQVLSRGHNSERTLHAMQNYMASGYDMSPEMAIQFGRIAQKCGDNEIAMLLIARGLDSISSEAFLEATLSSCEVLGDVELEVRAYSRLKALFPSSRGLPDYRERLLMKLCRVEVDGRAKALSSQISFTATEASIVDALTPYSSEKIQILLEAGKSKSISDRDLILLCTATHASSRRATRETIMCAVEVSSPGRFERRASILLIGALKRALIEEQLSPSDTEYYGYAIAYVRRYVARNPDDSHVREAFTALFTVESSGDLGLFVMVTQAVNLVLRGVPFQKGKDEGAPQATVEELSNFLKRADAWLRDVAVLDIGYTRMPLEIFNGDPRALLNAMTPMIRFFTNSKESEDLQRAEHFSFIASTMAIHVPDTSVDINALRLVASHFALRGRTQRARDLAEQILELSAASEVRQRLGWTAFADIYHRCRSPIDALVGLSCAFELKQDVEPEDLWWEIYTLARIARDVGYGDLARKLVQSLRELQPHLLQAARHQLRVETLELSLSLMDDNTRDQSSLSLLVSAAEQHYRLSLHSREDTLPAVALLAQAIGLLEQAGGQAAPATHAILQTALEEMGGAQANYVLAISSSQPSIADAVQIYRGVESARNTDDVPGDLVASELVARRSLRAGVATLSPEDASAAIELLSDHALDPLDGSRALHIEWPLRFARSVCPEDGAVLMMALDMDGILTSVTVDHHEAIVGKHGTVADPFRKILNDWSENYPFRYGQIDRSEGNNEFFVSMEKLDFPMPNMERVIVVCEPTIQQVPLNLALIDGNLAGYSKAIGYIPSLTWLDAILRRPRVKHQQRVAWISEPNSEVGNSALAAVLTRTENTLRAHGFEIDTGGTIPTLLAGAQLAVIAAHGNVMSGGRFFHRVSDEDRLVVTPDVLARAMAGTELVILFVCSGGRTDRHPLVNTSIGLPKQLLSAGCRTVIASPWPLSPMVTGPWLVAFMQAWDSGYTALDATFAANKATDAHFGLVPQYSLAMTVYGDVLLRGT